ncbi:MAG: DUF2959 domain-containing protein [Congregibacter sp.]
MQQPLSHRGSKAPFTLLEVNPGQPGFEIADAIRASTGTKSMHTPRTLLALPIFILVISACTTAYYETLEKLGVEKRDILIDRIEDAKVAQVEASEQFADALEQFRATVAVDAEALEDTYDKLASEFERSENRAEDVRKRIRDVKRVSDDLFDEWEDELNEYSDPGLKRQSAKILRATQSRYKKLIATMDQAEESMDPVLEAFQDQVLILKHNLNSQAIGALRGELGNIERDIERLVAQMRKSIAEADTFVASLK